MLRAAEGPRQFCSWSRSTCRRPGQAEPVRLWILGQIWSQRPAARPCHRWRYSSGCPHSCRLFLAFGSGCRSSDRDERAVPAGVDPSAGGPVRAAALLPDRLDRTDDAAPDASDGVWPVDGLRGVPAVPGPRAVRHHRRGPAASSAPVGLITSPVPIIMVGVVFASDCPAEDRVPAAIPAPGTPQPSQRVVPVVARRVRR